MSAPSLRNASAKVNKVARNGSGGGPRVSQPQAGGQGQGGGGQGQGGGGQGQGGGGDADPWASDGPGGYSDEPPF